MQHLMHDSLFGLWFDVSDHHKGNILVSQQINEFFIEHITFCAIVRLKN